MYISVEEPHKNTGQNYDYGTKENTTIKCTTQYVHQNEQLSTHEATTSFPSALPILPRLCVTRAKKKKKKKGRVESLLVAMFPYSSV